MSKVALGVDGKIVYVSGAPPNEHRRWVNKVLDLFAVQILTGTMIVFNLVLVIIETDATAQSAEVPSWVVWANGALMVLYFIELVARMYAFHKVFFRSAFNVVDLVVVITDVIMEIMRVTLDKDNPGVSVFRILRLARLARAYRVMIMFPMLAEMVRSLIGAFEAVLWGVGLLSIVVTLWSIFAVQLIQPYVNELTAAGVYDGCERCPIAFGSVMQSNLTFIQQIVAGDSWGLVTIPIIEHHPWTAVFFLAVLVTVQLAIVNVILAEIVQTASDSRRGDLQEQMQFKEVQFIRQSKKLLEMCARLDGDGSGDISLAEILLGYEENVEFAATLKDMGIDKEELSIVFRIMDEDDSGAVDYKEFVQHIHKMKTADVQTLLSFLQHYVTQILRRMLKDPSAGSAHPVTHVDEVAQAPTKTTTHKMVTEVTTLQSTFPKEMEKVGHAEVNQLQSICDELLSRLDIRATRSMQEIAQQSDAHLKLLASLDRSVTKLIDKAGSGPLYPRSELPSSGMPRAMGGGGTFPSPPMLPSQDFGACCSVARGHPSKEFIPSACST